MHKRTLARVEGMSECDSTAPSTKDAPPIELPQSSLPGISIIPLSDDLQFEIGSVEHIGDGEDDDNDEAYDPDDHEEPYDPQPSHASIDNKTPNRSGVRSSHRSYTVQYKLNVLDWYYAHGENKKQTAKHFDVDRKRIRDWLKFEQQFRMEPQSGMQRKKKRTGFSPHYKDLDKALLEWYKEQKTQSQKVTNQALRIKALELAPQLGYQDTFKASTNWVVAWRRRNKDALEDGNALPEDHHLTAVGDEEDLQQDNIAAIEGISGVRVSVVCVI